MKKYIKYIVIGTVVIVILIIFFTIIIIRHGFGPGLADYTYQINDQCVLTRTSVKMVTIGCADIEKSIDPEVINLGWNNDFIIATTHPILNSNSGEITSSTDNPRTYWWILDLRNKIHYGPFDTEDKYNAKKSELKIENIEFLSIDEAKAKATWVNGDFRD